MSLSSEEKEITIVSGLPRSGTSLAMQLLQAAGIEPYTDGIRSADVHNQKGYFESAKVLTLLSDKSWVSQATGKSLKVISTLLKYLPAEFQYRVVFMERSMDEIVLSQQRMLEGLGKKGAGIAPDRLAAIYAKELETVWAWMDKQENIEALRISYNALLERPLSVMPELIQFIGSRATPEELARVLDHNLYRSKAG
jgi:hypothetical protein